MKFSQFTSAALTIASLCTLAQAMPLLQLEQRSPEPAPTPQSYSVVAVDGGSSANNASPTTKTVTTVLTQMQVQTIISTETIHGSEQPTTILNTQIIPTTIVQIVTVTAAEATKTLVVEPSVTSVAYDDGQWHTTYYFRSTLSDVLVPGSSATAVSISSSASSVPASTMSTSTITKAAEVAQATTSTTSAATATTTDWSKYYGTWHETPTNGSWWGKRVAELVGLAKLS